jgi:hypothetical protein
MRRFMYSIHGLCACAALSIAAGFATSDASAAPLPIVAKHSGKCLDITGGPGATQDGAPAEQWECTGATNQSWTLQNDGFGRFQIIAQHSGLCLWAANGHDGTPLQQTTCNATDTKQLWVRQSAGAPGEFKFLQVSGGRCFEVDGGTQATGNGPLIKLKLCNGAANQTWTIGRNPFWWPFISSSIWNTPIGSGAVYVPANLVGAPDDPNDGVDIGWTPMPRIDEERIVLVPTAPLTTINYSSAGWQQGADRCISTPPPSPNFTGLPLMNVPIPTNYTVPNERRNNGAAFLMPDGHTLVQTQPLARCSAGAYATSIIRILDNGINGNNTGVDGDIISGDGRKGAHGGSMLGTLGGTIRLGEMRPGSRGPRHALKVNLFSPMELFNCTVKSECFRWPAYTCDSGCTTEYGEITNNQNTAMKIGALLAIPPSVNINNIGLETEPGRQIAWTLQNYGAYHVDTTGGAAFGIAAENGFHGSKPDEFFADYGLSMEARVGHNQDSAWSRDLQRIRPLLHVVNNNSPTSVGGGGTPRQPLAPPFQ